MTLTRRSILGSAAAASVATLPVGRVLAQPKAEFTYKYANNLPVAHPMNVRAKEMAAAILAETKGRVDIQIFPASQLGNDTDMLSQLRCPPLDPWCRASGCRARPRSGRCAAPVSGWSAPLAPQPRVAPPGR